MMPHISLTDSSTLGENDTEQRDRTKSIDTALPFLQEKDRYELNISMQTPFSLFSSYC